MSAKSTSNDNSDKHKLSTIETRISENWNTAEYYYWSSSNMWTPQDTRMETKHVIDKTMTETEAK